MPDAEMLLKLSQVLEYSFEQEMSKTPETASPLPESEQEGEAPVINAERHVKRRWVIVCAAVLMVVVCVLVLSHVFGLRQKEASTEPMQYTVKGTTGEVPPLSYFDEVVPNEAGKAYLAIEPTVSVTQNDATAYQMYDFQIIERNGIGFNIEYVIYLHYSHTGSVYRGVFTAQDFRSFNLDPNLPPYGTMPFNGGFPQGEYDGTGIIIHGTDANGVPLVFHAYAEFK